MEEYDQTRATTPAGEEARQVTPSIPTTTEHILPGVDPNLSMCKNLQPPKPVGIVLSLCDCTLQ